MRVSLHAADLHYGGGLVLHTASSGSVPHLGEIYLRLADPDVVAVGETRTNIAYLNGLSPEAVVADAIAAIQSAEWSREPAELLSTMDDWASHRTAPVRMLIDCALHDFVARSAGQPLAAWLGTPDAPVVFATNQTLFWSSLESFLARAQAYVDRGFRDLKVRVAAADFSEDLRRIKALRDRFGQTVKIAADANGQWHEADALDRLYALAEYDLAYIEQPIPAGDWDVIERLAQRSPIPMMLDESVGSLSDVERICALGDRIWAHLKLVKLGGVAPTMIAARRLSRAGIPFMIGQMNEGGASTAAAIHVACASSPAFAELYGADGLSDDPVSGIVYDSGVVRTGPEPGLGVIFDANRTRLIREV